MKEDVMLSLMERKSVVMWNPVIDHTLTRNEFLTLARINKYVTAESEDGWLLAYIPSHNFESACASLGMYGKTERKEK